MLSEEETKRWAERFDHVALLIASALPPCGEAAARDTCERLDILWRRVSDRRAEDGGLTMHIVAALHAAIEIRFSAASGQPH